MSRQLASDPIRPCFVLGWFACQCAALFRATVLAFLGGRLLRPRGRLAYTYTPSGRGPVESAAPRKVPPGFGPKQSRAWHPREFGAVLGVSASLTLPAPPLPSSSRRYAPQCFVGGIPPPRLATCLTAHPTNRVAACRSVRHSTPRPLPHLPQGAFFFVAFALADVPSARLTLSAYPPERSGVAEGELNAGCKFTATLIDMDTTDPIRP